jgi:hypothetical protein
VDGDRCAQLGVGGSEAALASRLAQVDATAAQAGEDRGDGAAGESVSYGDRNPFGRLPSGWGK